MKTKYVVRREYIEWLLKSKDKQLIKVVSGVRRSGKSTLFSLYIEHLLSLGIKNEQIIFINFEDIENEHLADYRKLHDFILGKIAENQNSYVFLDEIQNVPQFEKAVDSLYIRKNIDLYITGSNAYFMSGELATLLSGRYIELKILPLSFKEYRQWHINNGIKKTDKEFYSGYSKSAFPYILFLNSGEERNIYLEGLYNTILLKDIVQRNKIGEVSTLENLILTLFSIIGSEVNISKIANTLKSKGISTTNQSIAKWVKAVTDSLIMYSARNYDIKGRRLLETNQKIYLVDVGFRRLKLADHIQSEGHILENIVFLELKRRGYEVYVGRIKDREIDFVAVKAGGEIEYYQVALSVLSEEVLERELSAFDEIKDNYPKYLLTLDDIAPNANYSGIVKMNVLEWMLE